jgi:C1A family cysteine protease
MRPTGWKPDAPDHRDRVYKLPLRARVTRWAQRLFKSYLRLDQLPPVFDQGQLGSCVGHGVAELCDYVEAKEGNTTKLSRLAIYYWARDGVPDDTGATIRDGIKAAARGVPSEDMWPYDMSKWKLPPSREAIIEGAHRAHGIVYERLTSMAAILDCIASGFPVVFGTMLYESFERVGMNGMVPMPAPGERPLGGHCMLMIGFATRLTILGRKGGFYVRNSWGPAWGQSGNCWIPFDYIAKNAADFWTIRRIAA